MENFIHNMSDKERPWNTKQEEKKQFVRQWQKVNIKKTKFEQNLSACLNECVYISNVNENVQTCDYCV